MKMKMTRWLSVIVVFGMIAILSASASAAILIDDMEEIVWGTDPDCTIALDTDHAVGSYSGRVDYIGTGEGQVIKTYTTPQDWSSQSAVTFWYKYDITDFSWTSTIYPRLLVHMDDGSWNSWYGFGVKTTDWTEVTLNFDDISSGSSAWNEVTRVEFRLRPDKAISLYIDHIQVVPEPATVCLLGLGSLLMIRRKRAAA